MTGSCLNRLKTLRYRSNSEAFCHSVAISVLPGMEVMHQLLRPHSISVIQHHSRLVNSANITVVTALSAAGGVCCVSTVLQPVLHTCRQCKDKSGPYCPLRLSVMVFGTG